MPAQIPTPSRIRFTVEPGDVPAEKAARRLHLTHAEFLAKLPQLFARGFPQPDPTTGHYDLEAIDRWRKSRHRDLFPELTTGAQTVESVPRLGMGDRFRETQNRKRHG